MTDVISELGDVIEVLSLAWHVFVCGSRQCKGKWLVIGKYKELTAFDEMTKMFDCEVDG